MVSTLTFNIHVNKWCTVSSQQKRVADNLRNININITVSILSTDTHMPSAHRDTYTHPEVVMHIHVIPLGIHY